MSEENFRIGPNCSWCSDNGCEHCLDGPNSTECINCASLHSKLSELEQENKRLREARFPIMDGPSIPWSLIAPHERQALKNHDQTLKRLAERGGLACCEAVAVLEDRKYSELGHNEARARLIEILETDSKTVISTLRDQLKQAVEALEKEKLWKNEDPRMLREQCRVGDVAFQHLFTTSKGKTVPDWVRDGLPNLYRTLEARLAIEQDLLELLKEGAEKGGEVSSSCPTEDKSKAYYNAQWAVAHNLLSDHFKDRAKETLQRLKEGA